jgi:signal transduction histidine kinase
VIAEAAIVSQAHRFVNRIGPLFVKADPDKLTQILTNLVNNATKYTPPGSTVTLSVACDAGVADVSVSDDGPGIPKDALPKLFERYYRVESAANVGVVGTGLGLAIVRQTAVLLGGRAWAESEFGRGATFHFTLPVSAAPIAAAA